MSSEITHEKSEVRNALFISHFALLNTVIHLALFIGAVLLYALTLNGDVQPADSGEFQIAAITLGIPHPPGYPLFTMLGWLFAQVPIGSPFARVSFLSVVASSLTLVVVSLTVQQALVSGRENAKRDSVFSPAHFLPLLSGIIAALALGLSTTFWAQATTTNIRSFTALFVSLMLLVSTNAHATRKATLLIAFAVVLGFGVGHHVSLVFIGATLGAFAGVEIWRGEERSRLKRVVPQAVIAFLLTQLVWLYLPLRDAAGARFAPGNLGTLDGLLFHIFARGFAGDMLAFAAPAYLFDRLALLPTLLTFQFSAPLLLLMAIAWAGLMARRRAIGIAWLIAFALHLFITITYRAPQTVEYALPCWVIACCALAGLAVWDERSYAPRDASNNMRRASLPHLTALFSLLLLIIAGFFAARDGVARWPSYLALGQDRSARADAEAVMHGAPAGAEVLSQWHQATPMWALQDIEGARRDVTVAYVFPRGAQPYPQTFAQQAAQSAQAHPTFITSFFERELQVLGAHAHPAPDAPAWQVEPAPITSAPIAIFDQRIQVVGVQDAAAIRAEAGAMFTLDFAWSISAAPRTGDAITVRIMRPDGRLAANADIAIPPDQTLGAVRVRRLALAAPMDLPPGEYEVLAGAYQSTPAGIVQLQTGEGREFVPLSQMTIAPASHPPATMHPIQQPGIISTMPRLIGVDYDTGRAGQVRVWLHWQLGANAQTVSLLDAAGQSLAAPQTLSAATSILQPQFLSLAFDVPPAGFMRESLTQSVLPNVNAGQRYVPFANQMVLVGSSMQRDANDLKLDLRWLSARPLVRDYIISARIAGEGLYQTHDSVPALGAIPTLKWIAGSRVMDRHPFALNGYAGSLRATVVVYDSVTQLPLPPLDERYDQGITVP